jgi:hypothetical protein
MPRPLLTEEGRSFTQRQAGMAGRASPRRNEIGDLGPAGNGAVADLGGPEAVLRMRSATLGPTTSRQAASRPPPPSRNRL